MKTISEELNNVRESEQINEALQEKNLIAVAKQLKKASKNFSREVPGSFTSYRWDLITSADVKVFPDPSKALTECRKILSYNEWGLILTYKGGEYTTFMDRYSTVFLTEGRRPFNYSDGTPEKIKYIESCDKIIIYYPSETTRDRSSVEQERRVEKQGMIVRYRDELGNYYGSFKDYTDFCQKIAKENIDRYKRTIAQNHELKDDSFEKLSAKVNDLLQRCLQVANDMAAGKINTNGSEYRVSGVLGKFYAQRTWNGSRSVGEDGILILLQNILKCKLELRNGSAYNIDSTKKSIQAYEAQVEKLCESVENELKKWLEK